MTYPFLSTRVEDLEQTASINRLRNCIIIYLCIQNYIKYVIGLKKELIKKQNKTSITIIVELVSDVADGRWMDVDLADIQSILMGETDTVDGNGHCLRMTNAFICQKTMKN